MTATFTIITPTIARPALRDCYESVAAQMGPDDRHLIVTDGIPVTKLPYMPRAFAIEGQLTNRWGNAQRQHALDQPRSTSHVLFVDDDDLLIHGALDVLRIQATMRPRKVILARFQPHSAGVTWGEPVIRRGNIGTPNICCPSDVVGSWVSDKYDADFDFVAQTCLNAEAVEPDPIIWLNRVVQVSRRIETAEERAAMPASVTFLSVAPPIAQRL